MREREVDENRYSYAEPRENVYAAKTRLNLNDLLERAKIEQKEDKKRIVVFGMPYKDVPSDLF